MRPLNAFAFLSLAAISGCATELTAPGRQVAVVTPLTATETLDYEEVGPIDCNELSRLPDIEESCRNQLRNKAATRGADIVVIESREKTECWPEKSSDCLKMKGRAYRKKAKSF